MPCAILLHVQMPRAKVTLLLCIPVLSTCGEHCVLRHPSCGSKGSEAGEGTGVSQPLGEEGLHSTASPQGQKDAVALPCLVTRVILLLYLFFLGTELRKAPTYPGSQHIPTSCRPSPAAPGGANT